VLHLKDLAINKTAETGLGSLQTAEANDASGDHEKGRKSGTELPHSN